MSTNFEDYRETLNQIITEGSGIGIKNGTPESCYKLPCSECDVHQSCKEGTILFSLMEWAAADSIESAVSQTNAQWLRSLPDQELAVFLRRVEQTLEGPWEQAFTDHFCPICDLRHLEICDHCPEGDSVLWWLKKEETYDI